MSPVFACDARFVRLELSIEPQQPESRLAERLSQAKRCQNCPRTLCLARHRRGITGAELPVSLN
jgi:hypothetical protein